MINMSGLTGHGTIITKGGSNPTLVAHGRVPTANGKHRKCQEATNGAARWCHEMFLLFLFQYERWGQSANGFLAITTHQSCRSSHIILDIGNT